MLNNEVIEQNIDEILYLKAHQTGFLIHNVLKATFDAMLLEVADELGDKFTKTNEESVRDGFWDGINGV